VLQQRANAALLSQLLLLSLLHASAHVWPKLSASIRHALVVCCHRLALSRRKRGIWGCRLTQVPGRARSAV
jgi:hypothetical protein